MPIGQISRGVDEAFGTNTAAAYDGIRNYAARGNFIPTPGPLPEPRRLAKIDPNDIIAQPDYSGKAGSRSLIGVNDQTMDTVDRLDSAKTFKRPGSRGPIDVKRIGDLNMNPQ